MEALLIPQNNIERLADSRIVSEIADALYGRLIGAGFDAAEQDLRLRLAMEQRISGSDAVPFGLDRMSTDDAATYIGLQAETLRATAKRKSLGLPAPYNYGKKLFWRRSELDAWIERQRSGEAA